MNILKNNKYLLVIFFIGCVSFFSLNHYVINVHKHEENELFEKEALDRLRSINQSLENKSFILNQLKTLFQHNHVLSREQFESYTSPLITNNPDILSIAWVQEF